MAKLSKVVGAFVLLSIGVFVVSVYAGTILWVLYPHINALFPTAADKGIIPRDLPWWDSVCITWIIAIFTKDSSISYTKK
jgi:hypothetical protein